MSTFKVGDKVRALECFGIRPDSRVVAGESYTVARVDDPEDGRYALLNLDGVSGGFFAYRFEKVDEAPEDLGAKALEWLTAQVEVQGNFPIDPARMLREVFGLRIKSSTTHSVVPA